MCPMLCTFMSTDIIQINPLFISSLLSAVFSSHKLKRNIKWNIIDAEIIICLCWEGKPRFVFSNAIITWQMNTEKDKTGKYNCVLVFGLFNFLLFNSLYFSESKHN